MLEAMLAMPVQKARMWSISHVRRRKRKARAIDKPSDRLAVIRLAANQNLQVIGETDETPIEHPMHSSRQSEAITHDIRTTLFDGTDMCRLDLGPATSIDELQTRDCTAGVIGCHNPPPKQTIAYQA